MTTVWQSLAWKTFQEKVGRTAFYIDDILVIEKPIFRNMVYWEVLRADPGEGFWKIVEKQKNVIFLRISPKSAQFTVPQIFQKKIVSHPHFPSTTRILDLGSTEADLLAKCSQQCRRHLRKAEEVGIRITESSDVESFAKMAKETAVRDGFFAHPTTYYRAFLENFGKNALLLMATRGEEKIAAGIFLFWEKTAYYYYGASVQNNDNAPTLIQWEAIRRAKLAGCEFYDFLGVADDEENPKDPLFGVSQFKRKFGGKRQEAGTEQYVLLRPVLFLILQYVQKAKQQLRRLFS